MAYYQAAMMKTAAQTARRLLRRRLQRNFSYAMKKIFDFLNPRKSQRETYTEEEREELLSQALKFAELYAARRGEAFDATRAAAQFGKFVMRPERDVGYAAYWASKAAIWCDVAGFAMALGAAVVTEASVERSFSAQALVFTRLRARLGEKKCETEVWLRLNHTAIHQPQAAAQQAVDRQKEAARKREHAQARIEALWAKKMRVQK